jgi:hypothetical protein
MPKPSVSDTTRSHDSWAEVRAHDTVMRYRRAGAGRAIVVLRSVSDPDPFWPELLEVLRLGYRLIVPEPPAADADVAAWLASFLEGLGTSTVRILAADRFCIPALELALLESDQIARIVLVAEGPAAGDAGRGALESAMGRSSVPLLVVRGARPANEGISLITDFLAEVAAAPA